MSSASTAADVFTVREIARAAGVSVREVQALMDSGAVGTVDGRFVPTADAVRAVRLVGGSAAAPERQLFGRPAAPPRTPGRAMAASGALHAAMLAAATMLMTMGVSSAPEQTPDPVQVRLVFLPKPGPGGGGGGGGLRQPAPPSKAELKGTRALRSPVPPPKPIATRKPEPRPDPPPPVRPEPVARPIEPPPPPVVPAALPQVVAPVAPVPADTHDRAGVAADAPDSASHGPGTGGGAGTGRGSGMGEGDGSGIGPGSGGGTGGGPYRPGSGITPPGLLKEIRPDYTEDARRRGIEGDVVLEIVVRADGGVGSVRVLQGLGGGLDQRAVEAVRQWRFSPARRYGAPVDVIVEVAVEFKLR